VTIRYVPLHLASRQRSLQDVQVDEAEFQRLWAPKRAPDRRDLTAVRVGLGVVIFLLVLDSLGFTFILLAGSMFSWENTNPWTWLGPFVPITAVLVSALVALLFGRRRLAQALESADVGP